jgi:hypothetical protein
MEKNQTVVKKSHRSGIVQVLRVCGYHFSRWRNNKRVVMSFLMAGVISFLLTEKVMNFSLDNKTALQLFEPFVWVYGDGESILLCALAAILLFADMPFLDGAVPYYLIRIKVRIWVFGQILYIICATFLYTVFTLLITCLFCLKNAFIGNMWSPTAALLGYSKYGEKIAVPAMLKTFELSKPVQCMLTIFLLMLLYVLFSVLIMFVLTVWKSQVAGITGAFVFHIFGYVLNPDWIKVTLGLNEKTAYIANILCGWLSPLREVTYHLHNFGYDMLPRLRDTYLIFISIILLLLLLIIGRMKRYNFNFLGTMEE